MVSLETSNGFFWLERPASPTIVGGIVLGLGGNIAGIIDATAGAF